MDLRKWLFENCMTAQEFGKIARLSHSTLHKILNHPDHYVSRRTARLVEQATKGAVKALSLIRPLTDSQGNFKS